MLEEGARCPSALGTELSGIHVTLMASSLGRLICVLTPEWSTRLLFAALAYLQRFGLGAEPSSFLRDLPCTTPALHLSGPSPSLRAAARCIRRSRRPRLPQFREPSLSLRIFL